MRNFYLTAGAGAGRSRLTAFDTALRAAGLSDYNLVRVSSIIPPGAVRAKRVSLPPGSPLYVAWASAYAEEGSAAAAIAVALPEEPDGVGVIMEEGGLADLETARRAAEEMAREAMANRGLKVREVLVESVQAEARGPTALFAGVALF